jgi:hypothetical protein
MTGGDGDWPLCQFGAYRRENIDFCGICLEERAEAKEKETFGFVPTEGAQKELIDSPPMANVWGAT